MKSHKDENIHFIGVGGASMSALAKFVVNSGGNVTGSDRERTSITEELESIFPVYYGEHPEIIDGCDRIVYSSAIQFDNSEMKRARELKIPLVERHEFLGQIADTFEKTVAIGGAHGKTTVTAMISHLLKWVKGNFSAHIGGETQYGNLILSGNEIFVTEACEYKKSLLSLNPHISVLLNAELDHPDCYKDMKSLLQVYLAFLDKADIQIFPAEFINICKSEHMNIDEYKKVRQAFETVCALDIKEGVVVFSNGNVSIWTRGNVEVENDKTLVEVYKNNEYIGKICLPDKDETTAINSLFSIVVLDNLGYSIDKVADGVQSFQGVKRRKECIGQCGRAKVVFDYAHHPTQIRKIISSFSGKTMVIFQPHTYTRTKAYFDDFATSLSKADKLLIVDTYGAREEMVEGADSLALAHYISTKFAQCDVEYIKNISSTIDYVVKCQNNYDNILFLGAGDIYKLKDEILPYVK